MEPTPARSAITLFRDDAVHDSGSKTRRIAVLSARSLLVLALASLAGCGGGGDAPPDVVLITLDTTRADHLSAYGHPTKITPHLDALAEHGTRFDLAISTSAVTPVSHASILTGLYNHEHGLRVLSAESGFSLREEVPTLATVLGSSGYHTAAIHSAFPVSRYFGLDNGFDVFESFDAEMQKGGSSPGDHRWGFETYQRRSDETSDLVLGYLEDAKRPFFLWIHYWDPHDTAIAPPGGFVVTKAEKAHAEAAEDENERMMRFERLKYKAEVAYMDSQIGRVLEALDERRGDGQTLIAVVSDHGQGLFDHGWWSHRILYQEQIRVPLILKVPGEQRRTVPELVRSIDLMPTILDYLGITPPEGISGRSLRGLMEGETEKGRIAIADQINGYDLNAGMLAERPSDDFVYVAMDANKKLIYRPAHPHKSELFDLSEDPKEQNNVYTQRPYDVRRLKEVLARQAPWVTAPFENEGDVGVSDEALEALQALGYVAGDDDAVGAAPTETGWVWTCPGRPDLVSADRRAVGQCDTPLIPIRFSPNDG